MALSQIDRTLLQRCLTRKPRAWEDFVDRYLGLVAHVVSHTARARSIAISNEDSEDLVAEVFLAIVKDDFALLRRFRGESSLATYLTVVARRLVVRELLKRKTASSLDDAAKQVADNNHSPEERITNQEEVQRLIDHLEPSEAEIVRMYHLDGKSYQEISAALGMSENSVGPALSRAREKMRQTTS